MIFFSKESLKPPTIDADRKFLFLAELVYVAAGSITGEFMI